MNITITMTAEEYDDFRQWQKDNKILEVPFNNLRAEHEKLCNLVLTSVILDTSASIRGRYKIINNDDIDKAVKMANDWFC